MKRKYLFSLIIIIIITVIVFILILLRGEDKLADPGVSQESTPVASPSPETPSYNPPPEVKFDSSTDLKAELEKVNPQVLDSDFE